MTENTTLSEDGIQKIKFLNTHFIDLQYNNVDGSIYIINNSYSTMNSLQEILKYFGIDCFVDEPEKDLYILFVFEDGTYKLEMELLEETWKRGKKFKAYEGSTRGRIRNIETGYILQRKPKSRRTVEYILKNFEENFTKTVSAHQFICDAYHENPENKPTVDHINIINNDNRPSNLRFATHKEQSLNKNRKTETIGKKLDQYTLEGEFIKTHDSIAKASRQIKSYINMKGNSTEYKGFIWKYSIIEIPGEIWTKIPESYINYNCYISNKGRFRRGEDNTTITYGQKHTDGYIGITILNKNYRISRLYQIAHGLLDPNSKDVVDHIDENIENNTSENLETVTVAENNRRSLENRQKNGSLQNVRSKYVLQMDKEGNIIKEFPTLASVKKDGFDDNCVKACCDKKPSYNTHKSFVWKYK